MDQVVVDLELSEAVFDETAVDRKSKSHNQSGCVTQDKVANNGVLLLLNFQKVLDHEFDRQARDQDDAQNR